LYFTPDGGSRGINEMVIIRSSLFTYVSQSNDRQLTLTWQLVIAGRSVSKPRAAAGLCCRKRNLPSVMIPQLLPLAVGTSG
jgi:hypothetical protein